MKKLHKKVKSVHKKLFKHETIVPNYVDELVDNNIVEIEDSSEREDSSSNSDEEDEDRKEELQESAFEDKLYEILLEECQDEAFEIFLSTRRCSKDKANILIKKLKEVGTEIHEEHLCVGGIIVFTQEFTKFRIEKNNCITCQMNKEISKKLRNIEKLITKQYLK